MSLNSGILAPNLSKSALKKLNKKVQKAKSIHGDLISFSAEPTDILLLTNGGLKNDISRECLEALLHGLSIDYLDLIMTREHVFSLLVFHTIDSSIQAYNLLHGCELRTPELPSRPIVCLCATFVDKAPSIVDNIKHLTESNQLPDGLIINYDVLTDEESVRLIDGVLEADNNALCHSSLKHRFVRHFGYEFLYGTNMVDVSQPLSDSPIPDVCEKLIERLISGKNALLNHRPNQLTVNVYEPGQGIPPHVDTHSVFEDEIVSISLLSDTVMHFSNPLNKEIRSLLLPKNSALIMRGESRYLWKHSITPRKYDLIQNGDGNWTKIYRGKRISLTFRKVKDKPECSCKWSSMCDFQGDKTQQEKLSLPQISLDNPSEVERKYVKDVYENIASHFSATRHSGWPAVVSFLRSLTPGGILLDVGCGNGKYLHTNDNLIVLPSDFSFNLCTICKERGGDPIQCDMLHLPYRAGIADSVVCIAAIHHLSTSERRLTAINEIARVLKPGGRALITVWALEQDHRGKDSNYISRHKEDSGNSCDLNSFTSDPPLDRSENASNLKIHVNRTKFRTKDMLVPWHNKSSETSSSNLYHRYYHLFSENELDELCTGCSKFRIDRSFYEQGNWCVVAVRC